MQGHPPKPRVALTLGIIGHRSNRISPIGRNAVVAEVSRVLDALINEVHFRKRCYGDFFSDEQPSLSLVSALADGADSIAAKLALARGFALDAPLPFAKDVYQVDFTMPDQLAGFNALLPMARSVLNLPGTRDEAPSAYEAAGLTALGQSDVLLTVWDGGPSGGRGGTTEMLIRAARRGIPIIWIDANGHDPTKVLWGGLSAFPIPVERIEELPSDNIEVALTRLIDEVMRPPNKPNERRALINYLSEPLRMLNLRLEYSVLMNLLGDRRLRRTDVRPMRPDTLSLHVESYAGPITEKGGAAGMLGIALACGWAEYIATRFAQVFRSAFTANFLFAAFAVMCAVGSMWSASSSLILGEAAFSLGILANTLIGRRRGWQSRWLEAREVAERLRVAIPFWILGARPAITTGEQETWTSWYVRAILRAQPPRSATLDKAGLRAARSVVLSMARDQQLYYQFNAIRMHKVARSLDYVIVGLFSSTLLIAVGLQFFESIVGIEPIVAGLPALAIAMYGIRLVGDFEGIAKRADCAQASLKELILTIEQDSLELGILRARARSFAEIILGDLSSWRLSAESRGLAIPG